MNKHVPLQANVRDEVLLVRSAPLQSTSFNFIDCTGFGLYKSAFDVAMSAIALMICAPIMLLVALAIKLESPGPVFFKQERRGIHGRLFHIYKFRTMQNGRQGERSVAGRNDARITRVGKFLRDTHIDELPQFLNVIRGEMSIIGPRPLSEHESGEIELLGFSPDHHGFIHRVRPGMIGLEQVSRSRKLSYGERFALNHRYAETLSASLDLFIFVKAAIQCRFLCAVAGSCLALELVLLAISG